MKWMYKGNRKRLFGRWCYSGDVINNKTKPPGDWVKDGKGKDTIEKKVGVVKDSNGIESLRAELSKKKMKDIRVIGKKYDAYDTSKSELIQEIIDAKIKKGEL